VIFTQVFCQLLLSQLAKNVLQDICLQAIIKNVYHQSLIVAFIKQVIVHPNFFYVTLVALILSLQVILENV
jgi:hypothetical protein